MFQNILRAVPFPALWKCSGRFAWTMKKISPNTPRMDWSVQKSLHSIVTSLYFYLRKIRNSIIKGIIFAFIYDINSGHTIYVGDVLDCYKRMAYSRLYYPYTEIYEFENIITRSLSKSLDVLCTVMNYFLSLNDNQSREFLKKNPQDIEQILELKMQEGF